MATPKVANVSRGRPMPTFFNGVMYKSKTAAMDAIRALLNKIYSEGTPTWHREIGKKVVVVPDVYFTAFLHLLEGHYDNKIMPDNAVGFAAIKVGRVGHCLYANKKSGGWVDFSWKKCLDDRADSERAKIREANARKKEKEKIAQGDGHIKGGCEKKETCDDDAPEPASTKKRKGNLVDDDDDEDDDDRDGEDNHQKKGALDIKHQRMDEEEDAPVFVEMNNGKTDLLVKHERSDDDPPGAPESPVSPPISAIRDATREAIVKVHRAILHHSPKWIQDYPFISRILPCRPCDAPDEVYMHVYHFPGDLSSFPRIVVVDSMLSVPVRFYSASFPSSDIAATIPLVPSAAKKGARTHKTLRDAIKRHAGGLFGRFNVTMVAASARGDEDCIVVYVTHKGCLPYGDSPVPSELDGYPVVTVEGEFQLHGAPEEVECRCRPLRSGSMITGSGGTGTLGAIVHAGGENYALTCRHLFSSLPLLDSRCYQPEIDEATDNLVGTGFVDASTAGDFFNATVDVAMVKTAQPVVRGFATSDDSWKATKRRLSREATSSWLVSRLQETHPLIGEQLFDVAAVQDANPRFLVLKIGSATQFTFGELGLETVIGSPTPSSIRPVVDLTNWFWNCFPYRKLYYNNFIVRPHRGVFSASGDSGSLVCVLNGDTAEPAGILVGGCRDFSVVTPMQAVLDSASRVLLNTTKLL